MMVPTITRTTKKMRCLVRKPCAKQPMAGRLTLAHSLSITLRTPPRSDHRSELAFARVAGETAPYSLPPSATSTELEDEPADRGFIPCRFTYAISPFDSGTARPGPEL